MHVDDELVQINRSPEEEKPQIVTPELEEELKKEAKEWYSLSKNYKQNRYFNEDKEAYVINKTWLREWKKYIDYQWVKDQYNTYNRYSSKGIYKIRLDKHPGQIDNSVLLVDKSNFYNDGDDKNHENQVIRHDIDQSNELRIINKPMWDFLHKKYNGGPVLVKYQIEEETKYSSSKKIEIFYRDFKLLLIPDRSVILDSDLKRIVPEIKSIYISKKKNLVDLKEKILKFAIGQICSDKPLKTKNIRLWRYSGSVSVDQVISSLEREIETLKKKELIKFEELVYLEYTNNFPLNELDAENTDTIIVELNSSDDNNNFDNNWVIEIPKIEMKNTKCDWCNTVKLMKIYCQCKEVWYCSETCKTRDENYHERNCKKKFEIKDSDKKLSSRSKKGLVGLQNLGNTCFMNTSLQCISNCYELATYFLNDTYKKDINTNNPLGTQGALARSFANLLKELYYGDNNSFSPRNFKNAIETFQPMFSGYQQHDTQEFLNYLLDGLHEDLNRVIEKPFIEKNDEKNEDSIKARQQWIGFLRRNQSVLVDLLYGQYKSTITCPCSNICTTFDPYMSISLPLVNRVQPYEVTCFFIFFDISITPIQLELVFYSVTNVMALRNKIAKLMDIDPFSFLITKMDSKGSALETLLNTKTIIGKTSNNYYNSPKPFFLFQLDPKISNFSKMNSEDINTNYKDMLNYLNLQSERNKVLFSDKYEEQENSNTTESEYYYSSTNFTMRDSYEKDKSVMKYNCDDNYGFSSDFIITQIHMLAVSNTTSNFSYKSRQSFPRIIYINKNWTTEALYKYLFDYFYPEIKKQLTTKLKNTVHDEKLNNELIEDKDRLYEYFYQNYKSSKETDTNSYYSLNNIPFRIYINSFYQSRDNTNVFSREHVTSAHENEGVLISKDNLTIEDYIKRIPENKNKLIDNTFLFMSDYNRHFCNISNRDFYFQISWHSDYSENLKLLNEKNEFDFKVTKTNSDKIYLDECFAQFCKEEQLEQNNEWYCSVCKNHVKAKVHMELYSTPPIMIIHLKRFKNNQKINTQVDFPINDLDMSKYIIGPSKNESKVYDLFAVAHHYGGLGGGHYVASAKNHFDGNWYNFNDSSVSLERTESVTSSSAYVLYYKHKDFSKLVNLDEIFNKSFVDYKDK